jgi:hypothetical protein
MPNQIVKVIHIITTVLFSFLGAQAVHEAGHVLGAWWTGGTVQRVVLHPLALSRTDVFPNPAPHFVVWAGPLFGCVAPLLVYGVVWLLRVPGVYLFRFFAGACMVMNGAYIGLASFTGDGDADIMLLCGSPRWLLMLFGVVALGSGLFLWHNQGKYFGIGREAKGVHPVAALATVVLLVTLVAVELAFAGSQGV